MDKEQREATLKSWRRAVPVKINPVNIAAENQPQKIQIDHTIVNVKGVNGVASSAETTRNNYPPVFKVECTSDVGIRTEKSNYEIRRSEKDGYIGNGAASSNNNFYGVAGTQESN
jgi:hypothetical protein